MKFDPRIHRRRSIRLQGYDYSQPGAYFVTICTQTQHCLFGEIANGEMLLNDSGRMISRWWAVLASKFPRVQPDLHVVMPNHFHGIVIIEGDPIPVGAALRGRPLTPRYSETHATHDEEAPGGAHAGAPLPEIVGWLKTMTTNEYIRGVKERGWPRFHGRLWQRDYYERVFRSEEELRAVRQYVLDNPRKWEGDLNHPSNLVVAPVEAALCGRPQRPNT